MSACPVQSTNRIRGSAWSSAATARAVEYEPQTALRFLTRRQGSGPVVIGQLGQSLDGRIATIQKRIDDMLARQERLLGLTSQLEGDLQRLAREQP